MLLFTGNELTPSFLILLLLQEPAKCVLLNSGKRFFSNGVPGSASYTQRSGNQLWRHCRLSWRKVIVAAGRLCHAWRPQRKAKSAGASRGEPQRALNRQASF